ncbi:flagellar hook-associated protein 2 [Paraliobacillus sediminis]|uniref:flagellar hook-associated protein 2 n=1 Tax=Paraliobacillus sediminis TaxID=1885916 RepID=UPI000E3BF1D5|nr:flagellar hook-associated protein 2 [Paraliobacillus sediminis]
MVSSIGGSTLRVGGLASGMDIDGLVESLMQAEKIPLQKMEQDKIWMEWQRDAYRDVNTQMSEFESLMLDMKKSSTYNAKSTTSTQSDAITATASSSASSGAYSVEVTQLASSAINVSSTGISADAADKIDATASLASQEGKLGGTIPASLKFTTYHNGTEEHEIQIDAEDSLNDVLKKITDGDNGVRAFYDTQSDMVVIERTGTGDYNEGGAEIDFSADTAAGGFFTNVLKLTDAEKGGTNAKFTYNGAIEMESKTNKTTLNGINFTFNNVTEGAANISVDNNTDAVMEKITNFVTKYNELIDSVNGKVTEKRNRDYQPLTVEQKEEMSESEIELWEEKSKSGLLKSDSTLTSGLSSMRQNWYAEVDTGNEAYGHLSNIGIKTSTEYQDNGKLVIDEDKLRAALEDDSTAVYKLFSNNTEGNKGLINRLDDSVSNTMSTIKDRAGSTSSTLQQYSLGKRLDDITTRMADFTDRLKMTEDRYWGQFSAMEQAIQKMNQQSSYLSEQFGA